MKNHRILSVIVLFIVGCAQPLTPEEYVRTNQLSFSENASYRFDLLIDSMSKNGNEFGSKFFLLFLRNNCISCNNLYPAIQELKIKTKDYYDTLQHGEFVFYSFFHEEETESYSNWLLTFGSSYIDFMDEISERPLINGYGFDFGNPSSWGAPTVMFYDTNRLEKGVKTIWWGVPGSTTQEKAIKLANLWTYTTIENYPY